MNRFSICSGLVLVISCLLGMSVALGQTPDSAFVVAWGYNSLGQCDIPAPNLNYVAVSGGFFHSLGLKLDGMIVAWGYNSDGQCDVPGQNEGFIAVAGGSRHSLGLKSDGTIVAWGYSGDGQCDVPAPNADFVAIAAGWDHNLGLKSDGTIVAWGKNDNGQCDVPEPNADFVAIAGGGIHSLGLRSDGSVVAWGSNGVDQCAVPAPNVDFVAIAAGGSHSMGLKSNGSIMAWGYNYDGRCDVPGLNAAFVAVAAGGYHSLGLKSNGTIMAWGTNTDGQCDVPVPNSNFIAIAGGSCHSLGLTSSSVVAVAFCSFSAYAQGGVIVLHWETMANEAINGYRIYRAERAGEFACITESALSPNERSYEDRSIDTGIEYRYQVAAVAQDGREIRSGEAIASVAAPSLALEQNMPNPFNPATSIRYTLPEMCCITLDIFDVSGMRIACLVNAVQPKGNYSIKWNGLDMNGNPASSGMYFYRLKTGKEVISKKMVLLR